jgi:hypothetical protein
MKTQTNYQEAKKRLKAISIEAKKRFKRDKPAICQIINESSFFIGQDFNLSEYKKNLLSNYASNLQP